MSGLVAAFSHVRTQCRTSPRRASAHRRRGVALFSSWQPMFLVVLAGSPPQMNIWKNVYPEKLPFPYIFSWGRGCYSSFFFRLAGTVRARRTASTASTPNNPWLFGSGGARQAVVRGLREPRRQARLGAVAALGQGDGRSGQGAGREAVDSTPLAWDGQSHPLKWN